MALIDIDDDLKDRLEKYVAKNKIDFPSMKNFADRAIREVLDKLQGK